MKVLVSKFASDESGATAIEYALIAAILGIGIIAGATSLGNAISSKFTSIGVKVTTPA